DWTNVRLGLVSGRPISFQMDLYEPLYVSRPVVEPELFASLRPPTYSGDLQGQVGQPTKEQLRRSLTESTLRSPSLPRDAADGRLRGADKAINRLEEVPDRLRLEQGVASAAAAT